MNYEAVIGLEVHIHLKTKSKLFCSCSTEFGADPNRNICPVCTGQPGVLPVVNRKAVELGIKTALSLGCKINPLSVFARKNYFYPDLPKNYQISQFELPLAENGNLLIRTENNKEKKIEIKRVHLEEDAGKLLHSIGSRELDYSLVDLNRTGIPLLEIVTQPEINSPEEAYEYLATLKNILLYIDVSNCNMEEGSLRCDANISIRPRGETKLGIKTELKNMNSFKGVRDALYYEIKRQEEVLNSNGKIVQETRLWDADKGVTNSMRSKEEAHDYRYFQEPDLPPLEFTEEFISEIRKTIPELPGQKKARFLKNYNLSEYDADVIVSNRILSDYYENIVKEAERLGNKLTDVAKPVSNWVTTELLGRLNSENKTINESPVLPDDFAELIDAIQKGVISGKIAKDIFSKMFNTGKKASQIIKEENLVQISDTDSLNKIIDEVIKENPKPVEEYCSGKEKALGSLVGLVMKKTQGKANPRILNDLLKSRLSK